MISADRDSNAGFTLMELLVGINLMFIVLTIMISVYLLTYKFIFSTTRKIEEKEILVSIVHAIGESMKKSQDFTVSTISDGTVLIIFDNKDTTAVTTNSIAISNYLSFSQSLSVVLQIKPREEELLTLVGGAEPGGQKIIPRKNVYDRTSLGYMKIRLMHREKPYSFTIPIRNTNAQEFKNL